MINDKEQKTHPIGVWLSSVRKSNNQIDQNGLLIVFA